MATLFDRILEADVGIRPQVPVTPLDVSPGLSAALGCEVLSPPSCAAATSPLDKFLHAVSNPT